MVSAFLLIVFGLAVGSFANVLIDRLPNGEDVLFSRSRCDGCGQILRWFELIPVVSFLVQNGKCRRCHIRLSLQYPMVECVMGVGFLFLFQIFSIYPYLFVGYISVFFSLVVISVADIKYEIIPDAMIIVGSVGAGIAVLVPSLSKGTSLSFVFSACGAWVFFFFLWFITNGKGLGFGDVKLVFLIGLLLGFPHIIIALYASFLTGAVFGIILIWTGKKGLRSHLPFGPFLIFGYCIAVVWGTTIVRLWMNFI